MLDRIAWTLSVILSFVVLGITVLYVTNPQHELFLKMFGLAEQAVGQYTKEGSVGMPIPTPTPTLPTQVFQSTVEITDDGFVPQTLTVKKGTIVMFTNKDTLPHQVASDPHPDHSGLIGFDSQVGIDQDATYTFLFDRPGTFTYHDHLNPDEYKGIIVVEE